MKTVFSTRFIPENHRHQATALNDSKYGFWVYTNVRATSRKVFATSVNVGIDPNSQIA